MAPPYSTSYHLGVASLGQRSCPSTGRTALLATALVLTALLLYYPVHSYPFCNLDDSGYVYNNSRVGPLDWPAIKWTFTHPFILNYDPLTLIAHSVNVQLFQLDSGAHHEVNAVLHGVDAALLFWLLTLATGFTGRSLMVAALFAIHPINVENVAWISELKTLLSTAFFFLAVGAYGWYARHPKRHRMMLVTFFFALGLMAKPQVITLPFVLLLWDYWPLKRFSPGKSELPPSSETPALLSFGALLREKVPLFIIAAVDAVLTVIAAHKASPTSWPYTFSIRLGNAILCYARYIGKALWPAHLALMYPHPGFSLRWSHVALSLLSLATVTALVIAQRHRRYLVVGWFWFLGTMVPTIGIIQIDLPAMADRYAYVPFVGLFIMICWGAADLAAHWSLPKPALPVVSCALLLVLTATTHDQIAYWKDNVVLWKHSLDVTGHNYFAHLQLSEIYRDRLQRDKALVELYLSERDHPDDLDTDLNIAFLEHWRKNLPQAMVYYQKVLANSKDDNVKSQVLANIGHIYGDLGDVARAQECYVASIRLRSGSPSPPPRDAINWQGDWWNDVGHLIGEHFHYVEAQESRKNSP